MNTGEWTNTEGLSPEVIARLADLVEDSDEWMAALREQEARIIYGYPGGVNPTGLLSTRHVYTVETPPALYTAGGHRIIPPRVHSKATKKRKQQRASRKANR